jgi:NitT/TauT family transport system substrate-binding protein
MLKEICGVVSAVLPVVAALGPSAARAEPAAMKLALHWNAPIAAFLPYYAAIRNGYYKDEGIAVELVGLPGSATVVTSVSAGDSQVGQAGAETILSGIAKQAAIKAIFLLYQSNPDGVIVYKDSGIKSYADLKGKTISMTVVGSEAKMLSAKLRQAGIDPENDLKLLNVSPGAKLTMMLNKQADATAGFINFQYIQAEMAGVKVDFLPFSTPQQPLYGHAVIANTAWLNTHKDETGRFLRASIKGLVWSRDNFDAAVDLVVSWDPTIRVDRELVKRDWEVEIKDLISGGLAKTQGVGYMEQAGWNNLATILTEKIGNVPIFTNEFIPTDAPKW